VNAIPSPEPRDWVILTDVGKRRTSNEDAVAVVAPADCYSSEEVGTLVRFCALIGMDYGELDVVRDSHSRLIYVVDANRTPIKPRGLAVADEDAAFAPLANALRALLPVTAD